MRLMSPIVRFLIRYSRLVVIAALLSIIPCAHFTARLYGNLKPDIEELLPRQSRSILDLEEIRSRLRTVQQLGVLVYSEDGEGGRRFVQALAARLDAMPKNKVAAVEYRIDRELRFFDRRKALFLEEADLSRIQKYVQDRIGYERELHNPLNIFNGVELDEPILDFNALRTQYKGRASKFTRFPGGYYATSDGKIHLMLVSLPGELSGIRGVHSFKAMIEKAIEEVDPSAYPGNLTIRYTGGVQDMIEEYAALVEDLEKSARIVFTVVLVALLVFFRSFIATGALLLALFVARFWTFAASWFAVGSLNANSAFMGSIVLGSGITFGVMVLARYLEERREGRIPLRSARIAMLETARATWTAALSSGLAYGALYFTEFEGFRQYGIMGFMGMILCWISSIAVLPALLLEIERWRPLVRKGTQPRTSWIFAPLTRVIGRYPKSVLATCVLVTVAAAASFSLFDPDTLLEKNLSNLRNKTSLIRGSVHYGKDARKILGDGTTPLIVLAHDEGAAIEIANRLKERQLREGEESLIAGINSLQSFIPPNQERKRRILARIDRLVPSHLRYKLSDRDRRQLDDLLASYQAEPIKTENLPPLVKSKFTEKDGSTGRLVVVEPRKDSSTWSGQQLNQFVETVRTTADEIEGRKVPVAGTLTVTSDMIASIVRDGPKASLLAFLSVVFLIIVLFRKPRAVALVLGTLVLGNLWMFGVILGFDVKINFLNFIAIPITFGIGVDYAVNIVDRHLQDPRGDILKIVRETGGAVGLCSFTTIVGYSSLLIAQNQAFVSFGALAVLGEVTSMLAAITALPALILVLRKRSFVPSFIISAKIKEIKA